MFKKLWSLLLVLAVLFSLAVPALAESETNDGAAAPGRESALAVPQDEPEPFLIYDDTAGINKKPTGTAYVKQLFLTGVEALSASCAVSGRNFNIEVVLDWSVAVGSSWSMTAEFGGTPSLISHAVQTVGPVVWNEDGTADQRYTVSYASSTSAWNVHYERALSPATLAVIDLIDAIGEVDRSSGPAITAAREAYNALTAEEQGRVSNYEVLTAAEALYASLQGSYIPLDPPVLDASAATVGCYVITLAAPALSTQDRAATVQYRISADNASWGPWQESPRFDGLCSQTEYWFQARYHTSNLATFEHSAPSQVVLIPTAAPAVCEVHNYSEFKDAWTGAAADGNETLIRLVGDVHMSMNDTDQPHLPSKARVTVEGAGGSLYINQGTQNNGFYVDAGATLTLRDLTVGVIRDYELYWTPANCWQHTFRINGDGVTVNIENVRYYNNMGGSAASLVSAANGVEATVNVYSLAANPYFTDTALALSYGGNCTLNLMPTGDVYLMGQVLNATEVNVIPQPGFPILGGATRNASGWTAMDAAALSELNAGKTVSLEGLRGYALLVSEASAVPTALTAPTVARAGTPEAETADVVVTESNTSICFKANRLKSPQADSFLMIYGAMEIITGPSGTMESWRGYSDKADGLQGTGDTFTFTGLSEDTAYTYRVGWFSLEAGWTNAIVELPLHTSYIVRQLAAPILSEQVDKTGDSITLTPADPSTQDAGAAVEYRISSDGESWGAWQTGLAFTGLSPATDYWFQARYVAADYHWSDSEPSEALIVKTKIAALDPPVLAAAAAAATGSSVTLAAPAASVQDAAAAVQYRISEDGTLWGEWQAEPVFTGLSADTAYFFQARYLPSGADWLASGPSAPVTVTTKADASAPAFTLSNAYGAAGSEVTLSLKIENNPGIVTAKLALYYDRDRLELVGVSETELLPGFIGSDNPATYPFVLFWENGTAEQDFTVNGELATLTFRIKASAAEGDTARVWLSYDPDEVYNFDTDNVTFETGEGAVTIGAAPTGFGVLVENRTASAVTSLTEGSYSGEVSFTVTNSRACTVFVRDMDGGLTPLAATAAEEANTYSFTVTVDKPLTVVIALKGDVNGDGVVSVTDSSLINRSLLSESNRAYRALGPEEELIADVNGSGTITVSDASLLNRSLLSESAAACKALEW